MSGCDDDRVRGWDGMGWDGRGGGRWDGEDGYCFLRLLLGGGGWFVGFREASYGGPNTDMHKGCHLIVEPKMLDRMT